MWAESSVLPTVSPGVEFPLTNQLGQGDGTQGCQPTQHGGRGFAFGMGSGWRREPQNAQSRLAGIRLL